jgi:hypothetical protein
MHAVHSNRWRIRRKSQMHSVRSNRQGIRRKSQIYYRSNIVVKVIMPRTGQPGNCNSTTDRIKKFFSFRLSRLSLEPTLPPVRWVMGWSGLGLNVAVYLLIVQRLRMLGAFPAPSSRAKVRLLLNRACFSRQGPLRANEYVRLAILEARSKISVCVCHRISWLCLKKLKTAHRDSGYEALIRSSKWWCSSESSVGQRNLQSEKGTCEGLATFLPDNSTIAANRSKFTVVMLVTSRLLQILSSNLWHLTSSGIKLKTFLRPYVTKSPKTRHIIKKVN